MLNFGTTLPTLKILNAHWCSKHCRPIRVTYDIVSTLLRQSMLDLMTLPLVGRWTCSMLVDSGPLCALLLSVSVGVFAFAVFSPNPMRNSASGVRWVADRLVAGGRLGRRTWTRASATSATGPDTLRASVRRTERRWCPGAEQLEARVGAPVWAHTLCRWCSHRSLLSLHLAHPSYLLYSRFATTSSGLADNFFQSDFPPLHGAF